MTGQLSGRTAGPGWPHDDTVHALEFADAGGWTWLIVDPADRVVGELGTKAPPDHDGVVEIGYGLAAASRGRGLGTRAVATQLGWLDTRPDVRTVIAHVDPANTPSIRLLEQLGFTSTGHPVDGELGFSRGATGLV
jgi:RimJ/RimL family protein N-acetyltransferase